MAKKKANKTVTSVFAQLGLKDAEDLETKSKLVLQISRLMKEQELTQSDAAKKLGIDQPRVSDMLSGKLRGFSTERLMHFVSLLGRQVEIVIRNPKTPAEVEACIAVS
jgi:predicted XRE-type DNA-binding protein